MTVHQKSGHCPPESPPKTSKTTDNPPHTSRTLTSSPAILSITNQQGTQPQPPIDSHVFHKLLSRRSSYIRNGLPQRLPWMVVLQLRSALIDLQYMIEA
ncbi:hypothetical protein Bca4012_025135 [Brassica carinata]|uniref:Uncharacterized protein n=1 Tax=Brassica carinata TaxID=52824 RepID=A0A8X7VGM9_BRACI|nr:hypothetical protein Bca52824_022192 [Brassica carinata]